MPAANPLRQPSGKPEKLAYWFLRLNGCTTIENFIAHPDDMGSQRTDVDILGVRLPHRSELLTSGKPMHDHPAFTAMPRRIQIIFTEVKGATEPATSTDHGLLLKRKTCTVSCMRLGHFLQTRCLR